MSFGQTEKTVQLLLSSSAKFATTTGSTLKQNNVTWTVATISGTIQNAYQTNYNGQQFGTSKQVWSGKFSTSDITGKIKKVAVAANTGGTANLSVSVGSTDYKCNEKTSVSVEKKTSGINTYTFEGEAEGKVVVTLEGTAAACYLGSITVTYIEGETTEKTATSLTFPKASYTFTVGENNGILEINDNPATLTPSEAGTVSYTSDNENVATVDKNGVVTLLTENPAKATITASFAGNDKYKASEASYTIEVKKAAEDGVFDFSSPDLYGYDVPASSKNVEVGSNGTIIAGNVVITNVKDGNTNTRFYNNKGTIGLRVYKDAKLIISVPENYVVTDITIDANKTDVYTIGALNKKSVEIDFSNYTQIQSMIVRYTKLASLTTAASGFSTYAADYAVNYTEAGLKAYAVKVSDDKTKVAYAECTGVVPAGKAVLVKGTANTSYSLTPATVDADANFDTDLRISDGTKVSDGSTIFAFGTKNGVSGFKIVKSGVTIPAKKGYLVVEASAAGAKDFFAFDDSTNGIDDPTIEIPDDDVPLFNLAGQRVGKDYKGIVVKNGKKYVNK